MKEEWKKVSYLPPDIEVSSLGNVRRYISETETEPIRGHMSAGFKIISVKGQLYHVHKLVADAFIPNPDNFTKVRHRNRVRTDNRIDNLQWVSSSDLMKLSSSWATNTRDKVYCEEIDTVFGSMRTAAFITGICQDIIAQSMIKGSKVAGLTFRKIAYDDPLVKSHKVVYVEFEEMYSLAENSENIDEMRNSISDLSKKV